VIGSISNDYSSAVFCAVITHDGSTKNGFTECKDDTVNTDGYVLSHTNLLFFLMGAESPGAVSGAGMIRLSLCLRSQNSSEAVSSFTLSWNYSANLLDRKGTWDINKTKGKGREPGPGRQLLDRIDL
jgi:hypothetical protein